MDSMHALLKAFLNQAGRSDTKRHHEQTIRDGIIEEICLSSGGAICLVAGDCPYTSDVCIAIALEAAQQEHQVTYLIDKRNSRDVAATAVSQKLGISEERIICGNLDDTERRQLDSLMQKYSGIPLVFIDELSHDDFESLHSIKTAVKEIEQLGRLTKDSYLIVDWIGTWNFDSGSAFAVPEAIDDIQKVIAYLKEVADEHEIIVVVGFYPSDCIMDYILNVDDEALSITKGTSTTKSIGIESCKCECAEINGLSNNDNEQSNEIDGVTNWLKTRAKKKRLNSLGFQMRERLDVISREYQEQGKTYRFSLLGGDYGLPNGEWVLYCNGRELLYINDGFALRALRNNATFFDARVKKQIERLGVTPISDLEQSLVKRIETEMQNLRAALEADTEDKVAFENAWRMFLAGLKMSDVY